MSDWLRLYSDRVHEKYKGWTQIDLFSTHVNIDGRTYNPTPASVRRLTRLLGRGLRTGQVENLLILPVYFYDRDGHGN